MEKTIDKINQSLPAGLTLVDCRKKPLVGTLWGKRGSSSRWKIESARKEYWFRSISSIYRWTDVNGYTNYHKNSMVSLRTDDVVTYTKPKRFCYAEYKGNICCIIPLRNTWAYRKRNTCKLCLEVLNSESLIGGVDYIFQNGQLLFPGLSDKESMRIIKLIAQTYRWRAEKVSYEQLIKFQSKEYHK